ncbi:MAG: GNAT family N-acetyltransferase [Rhizobiales bacterium]|nr:GNAT family N-acetyltransferase [Hyphomicrobiales bacterium]NRB15569.1 GNAT family N-acetyltransferase [Hyphomicrobiales bacterium]
MSSDDQANTLDIIKASTTDIIELLAAQKSAFPDDPYNLNEADFEEAINSPSQSIWIAKHDNQFAGYIALNDKRLRPWTGLDNLIVLERFWGKKIGRKLLLHAIKNATRPIIRLFVEKNNLPAVKLYKTEGFWHLYSKANHYENNDSALVMFLKT